MFSAVPAGLVGKGDRDPAMNRRAIPGRPSGAHPWLNAFFLRSFARPPQ